MKQDQFLSVVGREEALSRFETALAAAPLGVERVSLAASLGRVVAETEVDIPQANVADAVMMLDLRNTTALMFRNTNSGELNMVYRREDGNIGWVEPGEQ